jgi:hypothetical protein
MDKTKTVSKPLSELSMHPITAMLPELAKDDSLFRSLVEDVRERGLDMPLVIDTEDRIVKGRTRYRVAKLLQLVEVECKVCQPHEVVGIILNGLIQRRHYTKGALAYIAFPLLEKALDESNRRRIENLKNPNKSPKATQSLSVRNTEQMAKDLGFCRDQFYQAREVHGLFKSNPALKADFEPKILSGEIGLGACIAGIAGKLATDGKSKRLHEQMELFTDAFDTLKTRFSYWQRFDAKQKAALFPVLKETVAAMPADLREELVKALKAANKNDQ